MNNKPRILSYQEQLDRAWDWYEHNIAYRWEPTGIEFTTLIGKMTGTMAIKVPVAIDMRGYNNPNRISLENNYNIRIGKFLFNSDYSLPKWDGKSDRRRYNVFEFQYLVN